MPESEKTEKTPATPPENPIVPSVRHLVRLMKRYDLTALDVVEGSTQIRLRRRGPDLGPIAMGAPSPAPQPYYAPAPAPTPTQVGTPSASTPPASAPAVTGLVIESPMVGSFYAASTPEAPPMVSIGSVVRPDTVVCIIEAMKVFTDIPAGVAGTVAEVLVKNGQSVEFGQPMFRINPA